MEAGACIMPRSFKPNRRSLAANAAPAAFFAAFAIGIVALLADQHFNLPRLAMVVAPIVIMVPGIYAFEMIVFFNRGQMLDALQASAVCGFVVGALAMGLATARFFSPQSHPV
jgi:uncharacterized membrane protein YjjB (DUF3815 family)